MPQSFVFALLGLALVLPVLGAVVLRILAPRLSPPQLYSTAALVFGVAFLSVLLLARANVSSLQVGDLSLLLPAVAPAENRPASGDKLPTPALPATSAPTAAPTPSTTATATSPAATAAPTAAPTMAATPTAVPTATPTSPPPTAPPTAVPPTETPAPSRRRTYVVQPGDTLRGIAEQFDVSVDALIEANHLTPAQADALRIGQELIIP